MSKKDVLGFSVLFSVSVFFSVFGIWGWGSN